MTAWLRELSAGDVVRKLRTRVLPNAHLLWRSRVRRCRNCGQRSVFLVLGRDEEFHVCIRCRANQRYEMLGAVLRQARDLATLDVLELDPASPLRPLLSKARSYERSYFRPHIAPGTVREDGAVCQDITALTHADASLDLIVSSDVLEHVPDAARAFAESARVLRPGGRHVFTVPPRDITQRRARMTPEGVEHLVLPPDYHADPLDPAGILVFWDYGPDLGRHFADSGLEFTMIAGPEGESGRVVWEARKSSRARGGQPPDGQ
jgi:SAM-dependent methyltransferase